MSKDGWTCMWVQWPSSTIVWTQFHSKLCSQCSDGTVSLGVGLQRTEVNIQNWGFSWWNQWPCFHDQTEPSSWRSSSMVWRRGMSSVRSICLRHAMNKWILLTHLCGGSWLGVQFHSDIMTTPEYEKMGGQCEDVSGSIFSLFVKQIYQVNMVS